jgi:hypothetical protein
MILNLLSTPVVMWLSALSLVVIIVAMAIWRRYTLSLAFRWLGLNVTLTPGAFGGQSETERK